MHPVPTLLLVLGRNFATKLTFVRPHSEIKQIATGVHFVSLITLGFMYLMEHAQTRNMFIVASTSFVLAIFIPPTGMIKPDDAPEYAKNSMSYIPQHDGTVGPIMPETKRKNKKESSKGSRKKKN